MSHADAVQPIALSVAGSDPSGGAGIQGDLKTFHAHHVYGQAVITLHTVQNTLGVREVVPVPAPLVQRQLAALFEDVRPHVVKTGAFAEVACVEVVAHALVEAAVPWIADPVWRASSGSAFAAPEVLEAVLRLVLPNAALLTPNALEVGALIGLTPSDEESAKRAARMLCERGARAVLIKGGHFAGEPCDVYCDLHGSEITFRGQRRDTRHTHGTGCALSAAIAARMALGSPLADAIGAAKDWLSRALDAPLALGSGAGPVNSFTPP